jgi:methyl-accepting chemotaxis protein
MDHVLYVLRYGPGTIRLKRGETIGILLSSDKVTRELHTASGYLENNDIILLETTQFTQLVTDETLAKALELSLPSDIAETLTPSIHKSDDGGASAIIVAVKGISQVVPMHTEATHAHVPHQASQNDELEQPTTLSDESEDAVIPRKQEREKRSLLPALKKYVPNISLSLPSLNLKTKIFTALALLLVVVLAITIFSTVKKQQEVKTRSAFTNLYQTAEKDYDEGMGLLGLNPNFAREDLQTAKQKLEDGIPKFAKGSEEEKKLSALLAKVNTALGQTGQEHSVTTEKANANASPVLQTLLQQKASLTAAIDDTTLYTLTEKDIQEFTDPTKNGRSIIKNDNDWANAKGLAAYNGNLYVLDTKEGVLKYVAGANGYAKSSYFTGTKPDVTKAVDIAIDGSVWILLSDGQVWKYTKGQQDSLTLKGLDKPFKNPTHIRTSTDDTFVYVLDTGNSRIVQLQKDGTFKAQYSAPTIHNTKAFDVNETQKKVYLLDKDTILSFPLQ